MDVAVDAVGVAPYDIAAVKPIVEAAGGSLTDRHGVVTHEHDTAISSNRLLNHAVVEITKNRSQEIVSEGDRVAAVVIKRIVRNNVIIQTAGGEKPRAEHQDGLGAC